MVIAGFVSAEADPADPAEPERYFYTKKALAFADMFWRKFTDRQLGDQG